MLRPSLLPGLVDALRPQPAARTQRRAAVRGRQRASRRPGEATSGRHSRGPARRRPSTGPALAAPSTSSTSRASCELLCGALGVAVRSTPRRADAAGPWPRGGGPPSSGRAARSRRRARPAGPGDRRGARAAARRRRLRRRARSAPGAHGGRRRGDDLRAQSLPRFPVGRARRVDRSSTTALPAATVRGTIRAAAPATLVAMPSSTATRARACPRAG